MGNFLVLNLFLALLLNSFSCEELKSRKEEINEDSKLVEGLKKIRTIAKATRTLVNLNSFERSDSAAAAAVAAAAAANNNGGSGGINNSLHPPSATAFYGPPHHHQLHQDDDKVAAGATTKSDHSVIVIGLEPVAQRQSSSATISHSTASLGACHRCQSCSALYKAAVREGHEEQQQRVKDAGRSCSSLNDNVRSIYGSSIEPLHQKQLQLQPQQQQPVKSAVECNETRIERVEKEEEGPVLVDWSFLIPTVLDVIPDIPVVANPNAALVDKTKKRRRKSKGEEGDSESTSPSAVLSGQEEMPDEPPDCLPASMQFQRCCRFCRGGDDDENAPDGWTRTVSRKWMACRTALLRIVKHPAFEWSILILIFGSSITLCFEDIYLEENPRLMKILHWTNNTLAFLFALEMIIKWFALGIRYYFSSLWTALDFVIVMVSLVSVAVEDSANLSALRSLRTLRALRPLRAISRWQGMKVNLLLFVLLLCNDD